MSLVVKGLRVMRGKLPVLDGIDLEVRDGEFVGVTGPSGCGKSTLLSVIAGLVPAAAGEIAADRRSLGYVFQRPMLLPWRSVLENAAFGLECRGMDAGAARERARPFLDRIGLGKFADYRPHELSEGMKQRLTLARAFLVEPKLVLMDEPFSSLDEAARRELQDVILDLWERARCTILFVSHSLDELVYLADRVVVFTERPSRVAKTVAVDLARPRGLRTEGRAALIESLLRRR